MSRIFLDDTLAAFNVLLEAEGESFDGKKAVAEVMKRRATLCYMSDGTVIGTILWPYQFSGWNNDKVNRARLIACFQRDSSESVWHDCLLAWQQADLDNPIVPHAVLYLRNGTSLPAWATADKEIATIGHHIFYRDP